VLVDERECPHCGASLRTTTARVPAVLLGLALTGCPDPEPEPVYGTPDSGPTDESDTNMDSGTEGTDSETTTVGEPEYGVPDSG
jgi:hypothetical protein